MFLNTNNLPWLIAKELRTIIHSHISDRFTACVLTCESRLPTTGHCPAEIAIDTDGTIIFIASFPDTAASPGVTAEMSFDFVAREARYDGQGPVPLDGEQERFQAWERTFVASSLAGAYRVAVAPILELEERCE
ncbi:hypothetical protein FO488_06460 [Geobacter sp. FeAm09]|uniref:DUF2787 family protein n=1 Tax=Geobacter sp. FeAm09 TaxID=2597769 RepID=UPI0011EFDE0C|nr:DUF2787 family protein [Geobacter sp. FeAm09]QEM67831.1 hypothetical protein FO488_06460 [Geobacter sp. FeAm09]